MPHKTKAEIENAKCVNLPDFLTRQGFVLKQEGQEYRWRGIPGASVSIKDNAPGEIGLWKQWSTGKGGTNIDFVMQFMDKRFDEAVDLLNSGAVIEQSRHVLYETLKPQRTPENPSEIHIEAEPVARRVKAYLSQTRGLDFRLINQLIQSGKIVQEQKTGNVCFLIQDNNGKTIGAEKVGTSTYQRFKGIATGSASGYGFEICRGKGENLLFFESAIDALSFLQMHSKKLDNHRLVSMMGVKPNTVTATTKRYGVPPEKVWLCADHDEAGDAFAARLKETYPQMHRLKTPARFKDWNDQLRGIEKSRELTQTAPALEAKKPAPFGRAALEESTKAVHVAYPEQTSTRENQRRKYDVCME